MLMFVLLSLNWITHLKLLWLMNFLHRITSFFFYLFLVLIYFLVLCSDCGAFVVFFANYLLQGRNIQTDLNIKEMMSRYAISLHSYEKLKQSNCIDSEYDYPGRLKIRYKSKKKVFWECNQFILSIFMLIWYIYSDVMFLILSWIFLAYGCCLCSFWKL